MAHTPIYQYAKLDAEGNLVKVSKVSENPLSAEQQAKEGVLPYEEGPDPVYDGDTHKVDGFETPVVAGVVVHQYKVIAKTEEEKHGDKLKLREVTVAPLMELAEAHNALILKMAVWIALQYDATDPKTFFEFSVEDRAALQSMQDGLEAIPLDDAMRKIPKPV